MPNPIIGLGIQGIHSEDIQTANQGFVSMVSVDNGSALAGQTISSGQTSQSTGYQLVAADPQGSSARRASPPRSAEEKLREVGDLERAAKDANHDSMT
jgi:hypothetical protein